MRPDDEEGTSYMRGGRLGALYSVQVQLYRVTRNSFQLSTIY